MQPAGVVLGSIFPCVCGSRLLCEPRSRSFARWFPGSGAGLGVISKTRRFPEGEDWRNRGDDRETRTQLRRKGASEPTGGRSASVSLVMRGCCCLWLRREVAGGRRCALFTLPRSHL